MPSLFSQEGKRLKIDTIRNGRDANDGKSVQEEPLLLLSVEGTEEFSKPFSYTVKLWRHPVKRPILDADALMQLVNSPVTLTIALSEFVEEGAFFQPGSVGRNFIDDDDKTQANAAAIARIERSGVFEDIKDEGFVHNEEGAAPNAFFQYSATIVPAFKMMSYETVFRVFENKTVIEIITDLTKTRKFPFLNVEFDSTITRDLSVFPKIPYCVQYQESTYNFLSRLMNRWGLWYYFDHGRNPGPEDAPLPHQSLMVIGTDFPAFKSCNNNITSITPPGANIVLDKLVTTLREPSPTTIRDFGGMFHPGVARFQKGGDFNPLDPTAPYEGEAPISPSRDLLKHDETQPDLDRYRKEEFHIPVANNDEASKYVKAQLDTVSPLTATFHGSTRNPAFIPGFSFEIVGMEESDTTVSTEQRKARDLDQAEISRQSDVIVFSGGAFRGTQGEGGQSQTNDLFNSSGKLGPHLITFVKFGGLVVEYFNKFGFFEKLKANLFPKGTSPADPFANFTNQGLNNYLQNQLPLNLGQPPGGPGVYFLENFLGGGLASVAALIPLIVKSLQDDDERRSEFHCSFGAINRQPVLQIGDDTPLRAPLPTDWVKPLARGPHLAVVIGRDGTDTKRGEIYADEIGRIRVRFAWDRRPDEKPGDQFKRGVPACWVRVSEGWAGRRFGTQFLPRIGQEVIVDFLDGDPDRPIVTGRVYNADLGEVNLPFPDGPDRSQFSQDDLQNANPELGLTEFRFNGIRTSSVPTFEPGRSNKRLKEGFHLLRFDDTRDKEQYLIRSQRRLDITALQNRFESIGSDRHLTVGGKDETKHTIAGDYIAKVYEHYHLHVGDPAFPKQSGNRNTKLEQDESLDVSGTVDQIVGGHWTLEVGSNPTAGPAQVTINALGATGAIALYAMTNITLSVGASQIVLTPVGISITAPEINLVGQAAGLTPVAPAGAVSLPPMPPLPAVTLLPREATPADPGDKLTPPKE